MTQEHRQSAERGRQDRTVLGLEIREAEVSESGRFLEGIAIPYGVWADIGWFMESHAAGSFERSIREAAKSLPLLLFHDSRSFPVGVTHEWRDGPDTLRGIWRIDTKDDLAVEAARKAEEGFLNGLSIGFAPIRTKWETDDMGVDWATRTESRLLEVSLTPTPAFAGAQVSLVRARSRERRSAQTEAWRKYLEEVKR